MWLALGSPGCVLPLAPPLLPCGSAPVADSGGLHAIGSSPSVRCFFRILVGAAPSVSMFTKVFFICIGTSDESLCEYVPVLGGPPTPEPISSRPSPVLNSLDGLPRKFATKSTCSRSRFHHKAYTANGFSRELHNHHVLPLSTSSPTPTRSAAAAMSPRVTLLSGRFAAFSWASLFASPPDCPLMRAPIVHAAWPQLPSEGNAHRCLHPASGFLWLVPRPRACLTPFRDMSTTRSRSDQTNQERPPASLGPRVGASCPL